MTPTPHTNAEALCIVLDRFLPSPTECDQAATMLRAQAQEIATLRDERDAFCTEADVLRMQLTARAQEIESLRTVMMAAAVEITEHWDAHCDSEGYGPANLVRRLENGYPSQYGYDAQTVVRMEKQIAELHAELEAVRRANLDCVDHFNAIKEDYDKQAQEIERLRNHIHTCGPNCTKAGCVNSKLRTALSALVDQAGYTIGYPSSSVQAKAARAALEAKE